MSAGYKGRLRPANPANCRAFFLNGKPKYFIQVGNQLQLRDGVSPWI